eukprot:1353288-Amorphochlora_amoeboformis.AAC.1
MADDHTQPNTILLLVLPPHPLVSAPHPNLTPHSAAPPSLARRKQKKSLKTDIKVPFRPENLHLGVAAVLVAYDDRFRFPSSCASSLCVGPKGLLGIPDNPWESLEIPENIRNPRLSGQSARIPGSTTLIIVLKGSSSVYRRYAGLYFTICVDPNDNELAYLESIHLFVEILDKYFGSVCELDLVFGFYKVFALLDEVFLGGEIQETSKKAVLGRMEELDDIEKRGKM